jgi:hypothetical protein
MGTRGPGDQAEELPSRSEALTALRRKRIDELDLHHQHRSAVSESSDRRSKIVVLFFVKL